MSIPVIDLFAGPGGLGEGFSSILDENGDRVFEIKLSIEKDENAHKTLELRSFTRQFPIGGIPKEYYEYVKNYKYRTDKADRAKLFSLYPDQAIIAQKEAWLCELGHDNFPSELVDERITEALDGENNWLLIGGPPCQAYSLVGRARRGGMKEDDPRVYLYQQYLRTIAMHQPAVFVMENVKGLLSAELDGESIFSMILNDLKRPHRLFPQGQDAEYRIFSLVTPYKELDDNDDPVYDNDRDFLIQSEKYGIPQKRHRVILLGVRKDVDHENFSPLVQEDAVSLREVIGDLPKLRSGIGRKINGLNSKGRNAYLKIEDNWENWLKITQSYLEKLESELDIKKEDLNQKDKMTQGSNYIEVKLDAKNNPLHSWYNDPELNGVLNHETRKHLKEDLGRYLFSSLFLRQKGEFPRMKDYPDWLLPNHKSARDEGKFTDRFRTQKSDIPATTITSHISKDGHYFIHYDPQQCRSLTVREAARVQTFPDNYFFCGSRTHQFHQVGNAVPPLLASDIGKIVMNLF
ncbi:DNA (cytosine-5-)-methyltransferase [Labilibaculum filiforme]|uniref:DNA (cytosine-5-)-methyltransferase n=1 Tax=Labilibaculum filiforme TaxID=1940526 RepID=A0A2N3I6I7_9BACT|nr:DNA cytosine methyltransferase [Labilibaculum filiforme]PKQ65916.1 DNA (cytosine-5-)-methyltransferase [Labilibaculum filiforme]